MRQKVAYCYVRSSTGDQVDTLHAQEDACRREYDFRLAKEYKWGGAYVDHGVSATKPFANRPKGLALDAVLEEGDAIICSKLDRAFRDLGDLVTQLKKWEQRGIRLILLDLAVDTASPIGKMVAQIVGAVAEFERARIAERTKDIIGRKKKEGKPVTGIPPYGFRYEFDPESGERKVVPDTQQRAIGRKVVEWLNSGWSREAVAIHLLRQKIPHVFLGKNHPWSKDIISRYYAGETALQAKEEREKEEREKNGDGDSDSE